MAKQVIKFDGKSYKIINGTVDILGVHYQVINVTSSTETLNILGGSYDPSLNYVIIGDKGNDTITGGIGHNIIFAGSGNNIISGGLGGSVIFGGSGTDVMAGYLVSLNAALGSELQPLDQSVDLGTVTIPSNKLIGGSGTEFMYGVSQSLTEQIIGIDSSVTGAGTIITESNTLIAGSGTDLLVGDFGSEQYVLTDINLNVTQFFHGNTLIAGSGTDTLFGTWGTLTSTMNGVSGIHPFTAGSNLLIGGSGTDLLIGDGQSYTLSATNSPIQVINTLVHNTLIAGSGTTMMIGDIQNLNVSTDSVSNGVSFSLGGNLLVAGTGNDIMVGSIQNLHVSSNVQLTFAANTFQFNLGQHLGNDVVVDTNNLGTSNVSTLDILKFTGVSGTGGHAPTVTDLDHLIQSFTADKSGHGTLVSFKHGGSIDFQDIAYNGQHSVLDLVNHQLAHVVVV